jgi:hypothetical protein
LILGAMITRAVGLALGMTASAPAAAKAQSLVSEGSRLLEAAPGRIIRSEHDTASPMIRDRVSFRGSAS